ncbi:PA2778 family cysteine peptidase [Solimonas soli]|uniref:PA2778 family cysteine peptidase n=1 Tax=Solimonas soli TaxID=413479 RepID=UPI0004B31252|nr:PA2778 family cysteine peptidase [Solimonas soli]
MRQLAALLAAVLLAACAGPQGPVGLPREGAPVELQATPFFPQREHQCGPAALATSLGASGVDIGADALTAEVYLPGRKGSLQTELVAAARRHGRVAAPVRGDAAALVAELRAGRPVLVLLNLGLSWLPVWHYAVVVGYEPANERFILRSGTERRAIFGAERLERAWAYGAHWAVVITEPERIPATTSTNAWLAAVAPFESLGELDLALKGYAAAATRWPDTALPWTALGNAQARAGDNAAAIAAYSAALAREDTVATRNNRADALGRLQCARLAELDLQRAAALDAEGRYKAVLARTRDGLPSEDACPAAIVDRLKAS